MSMARRRRPPWMRARPSRPAPVIVQERAVLGRPSRCRCSAPRGSAGFGCERVSERREDSAASWERNDLRGQRRGLPDSARTAGNLR